MVEPDHLSTPVRAESLEHAVEVYRACARERVQTCTYYGIFIVTFEDVSNRNTMYLLTMY